MIDEFADPPEEITMPKPGDMIPLHAPARMGNDLVDDVTRALPHAVGPEKSVLSSMLTDPQEFIGLAIEEGLTGEHFYLPAHSTLFVFLLDLFQQGIEIELVSLVQRLLDKGMLERVGGPSAVTDLYTYAPSNGQFRWHLRHVKDKFVLRSIINLSNESIAAAYDTPDEVTELLDRTEAAVLAIRDNAATVAEVTVKATVDAVLDGIQARMKGSAETMGLSTGFNELDNLGCRLKPGEMFVIAARPSMGKTSLMMNIVEHLCIGQSQSGMVFSLEMTRAQLIERLLYCRGKVNAKPFIPGYVPPQGDLLRLKNSAMAIASAKLHVNDMPGLSIGQLRAIARRKHRDSKLRFIAIDYLQLMKSTSKQATGSREREVAEISAGIKGLAKELGIPIIVLAQLNRGPENRTGKNAGRPRMSDLRESGSLEQDADMVGLLYRDAYYATDEADKEASAGRASLILDKNRNGATGTANLTFIAELMRFEDGSPAPELPLEKQQPQSRYDDN